MNKKTKTCQNCKSKFIIEPEDFKFYKKIDVPEPTFCPDCRMQRRVSFWNAMKLYKRKCDFSGKDIITIFHPKSPSKVYKQEIWYSDKWDPIDYGQDYDFSRPFFEQFNELLQAVPKPRNLNVNSVDCDYCVATANCKNCYYCAGNNTEDSAYSVIGLSKNCFDCYWVLKNENCYDNMFSDQCYNVYFSEYSDECIDSAFLYDCKNCQNCFACVGLRNKKYHIFNKPYPKKEYEKEIKKYDLGSFSGLEKIKKEFNGFKSDFPRRFARIYKSSNASGDYIKNAKNCHYCYDILMGAEDCKYVIAGGTNLKDGYDIFDGGTNSEILYEVVSAGLSLRRVFFSIYTIDSVYDVEYSYHCFNSSNLFGCSGLRHKKYCVFNKQYTKKEYEELVPKIKKHMNDMPYRDKKGRVYKYGEFFPIEFSPFGYNESFGQEKFPLTKKQISEEGYNWLESIEPKYEPTIRTEDIADNIKDINKSILEETIECANGKNCCGNGVFRVIPMEYEFYKKQNIALPRLCFSCRYKNQIDRKNPNRLWHRKCQCAGHSDDSNIYKNQIEHPHHKRKHCPNTFQTPYAPERKEIVYCEKCYNKEVS